MMMSANVKAQSLFSSGLRSGLGSTLRYSTDRGDLVTPAVGDKYLLSVSDAPPNSEVSVLATNNQGSRGGEFNYGNTDNSGNWRLDGTWGQADMGQWLETWMVGHQRVGEWDFTVVPASEAKKIPPAALLKPMPSIIPAKPGQVTSGQAGFKCEMDSWVSQNPLGGLLVALGIGMLVRRMK